LKESCIAHTEVECAATRLGNCSNRFFLVTFNPVTRQFSLFGHDCDVFGLASLIPFGVYFGQIIKDNCDKRKLFSPPLLSRLWKQSATSCNAAAIIGGYPQYHSGSSSGNPGRVSSYDPEGHRNKFSKSGSHSLERHRSEDHCS
jgi:hypothetical protein